MNRLAVLIGCLMLLLSSPAMAISEFGKQWKAEYLGDGASEEFQAAGKKANCNVCHVNKEDKKKVRNEYGQAVNKFLKAEDFPKEFLKDNPEKAKEMILEGFKKANELESKDGKKFGDKIKAGELPATDAGI